MNNKQNESYDSRGKNASHDQSHHSAFISPEKGKYGKEDKGEEADPRESLKEAFDIAKRLLIDGQPQQASEKCMKALKDANEIFGENSAESLPGYFILAEANIEEGKLKRAEDFLIGAYWNLLKHSQDEKQAAGNTGNMQKGEVLDEKEYMSFKGTLHKVFAKLYSAKREFDRAMDELKNGIYIDSCHYGPEDIQTSISYFNFGQILVKSGDPEKGYTFYNQGVKIWYKFFKLMMRNSYNENIQVDDIVIKQGLSQLKGAEALFLDRLKSEGEQEVIEDIYKLNYALAFIHKFIGEEDAALEYCRNIEGFLLGRYPQNHPKLNRFYNFFPNYQDNITREEGEEDMMDENQRDVYNGGYRHRGEENNYDDNRDISREDSPESEKSESQERPISQNSQNSQGSQPSQPSHHSGQSQPKSQQSYHSQQSQPKSQKSQQSEEDQNQSKSEETPQNEGELSKEEPSKEESQKNDESSKNNESSMNQQNQSEEQEQEQGQVQEQE